MDFNDYIFNKNLLKAAQRIERRKTISIEDARKETIQIKGKNIFCPHCKAYRKVSVQMPIDDLFFSACGFCWSLIPVGYFSTDEKRWNPIATNQYIPTKYRFDRDFIRQFIQRVLTSKGAPETDAKRIDTGLINQNPIRLEVESCRQLDIPT